MINKLKIGLSQIDGKTNDESKNKEAKESRQQHFLSTLFSFLMSEQFLF